MHKPPFHSICAAMLSTYYGLELNDTTLAEDYAKDLEQVEDIYDILNQFASRYDLQRIDMLLNQPLTLEDQVRTEKKLINKFSHKL
ncbi:hypothetical protein ABHF33_08785 [Chitinibacter sp. FCG-7]|uniref:MafI family immunity protein n=1 Tax=Chitinibacter mangrovi TaxID=3153927 RepID=A0AAU7F6G2_9NEIS